MKIGIAFQIQFSCFGILILMHDSVCLVNLYINLASSLGLETFSQT